MGRDRKMFTVNANLSDHNDEQDEIDERRWEELRARVQRIIEEYRDIDAQLDY